MKCQKDLEKKYVCASLHRKRRAYFNCPPRRLGTVEGIGKLLSCLARNWFTNRVWAMHATVAQAGRGGHADCGWLAARPTAIILTTRNLRWRCGWWRRWRRRDVDVNEDVLLPYLPTLPPFLSSPRTSSFYFLASKLKRQRSKLIKAKQVPPTLLPLPWQIADAPIAVWLWPKMNDFNA